MTSLATRGPANGHVDTEGKLILFVADPPSNLDLEAKEAIKDFDPSVEVVSLGTKPSVYTPRLDATAYNLSVYRGVDSILSFIKMRRRKQAKTREELTEAQSNC